MMLSFLAFDGRLKSTCGKALSLSLKLSLTLASLGSLLLSIFSLIDFALLKRLPTTNGNANDTEAPGLANTSITDKFRWAKSFFLTTRFPKDKSALAYA